MQNRRPDQQVDFDYRLTYRTVVNRAAEYMALVSDPSVPEFVKFLMERREPQRNAKQKKQPLPKRWQGPDRSPGNSSATGRAVVGETSPRAASMRYL